MKSIEKQNIAARDIILDNIRGLFVLMFIASHAIVGMLGADTPLPLLHAYSVNHIGIAWWGFNLNDLAPVAFMFLLGFIIYPVFERKYERAGKRAFRNHLVRYLALNGISLTAIFIQYRAWGVNDGWSFICDVATTAIFMTPFLTKPFRESTALKFIAGAVLVTLYGIFYGPLIQYLGAPDPQQGAGIGACIGYTGIVLVVAGFGDLLRKKRAHYYIGVGVLYLIGLLCTRVLMSPEDGVWGTYSVLWMVGSLSKVFVIFTILWAACHYLLKGRPIWGLVTIGRNLLLYILIALLVMLIPIIQSVDSIGPWRTTVYTCMIITFCLVLTIPLEKKKVTVKL